MRYVAIHPSYAAPKMFTRYLSSVLARLWQPRPFRPASPLQWVAALNSGRVAASTEVVVAPPTLYLDAVRSKLRKDFAVAAQVRREGAGKEGGVMGA